MEEPIIVFDEESQKKILEAIGIKTNMEGELVDSQGRIITNPDFESIKEKEFGGILRGSRVTIKKEVIELASYFTTKKEV